MEAPSVFKECDLVCFACKASEALEFVTPPAPNQQLSPLIVINRARKFSHGQWGSHLLRMTEVTGNRLHV